MESASRKGAPVAEPVRRARAETTLRSSGFALATQLTTASFTTVLTLYLVRALGPASYGIFALALSVGAIVALPADVGVSSSAQRFVAEHRGQPAEVAAVVADALRIKLVVGVLVCGALFGLAGPIASAYGHPGLTWPLRAMALAVLGQGLLNFGTGVFTALRSVAINLRLVFSESAIETGASIALVLLGGGATGAAFGRAIGYAAGAVLALLAILRQLGRHAIPRRPAGGRHLRRVARYAGSLFVIDSAFTLFNQIDVLLIGAYLSASAAGTFQAPTRLTTLLIYPSLALALGVAPRLAGRAEAPAARALFAQALRWTTVLYIGVFAVVVVWATPIVHLALGADYGDSADVLRVLSLYVLLAGLGAVTSVSVNYVGAARRRVALAIAALAVDALIDVILIPRIGIVAGAIATDVAYAIYVAGHLRICRDLLGTRLRPLAGSAVRALLAAAVAAAVLAALGTGPLGPAAWLVGAIAFPVTFTAGLWITKELTAADVRAIRRAGRAATAA